VKRRDFITLVGGAAAAWPLAAYAQQSKIPVIGFLSSRSASDSKDVTDAFLKGLNEVGFTDGREVRIEFLWANGQLDQLPALAKQLVDRRVTVIAAVGGEPTAFAAKRSTATIPIVFIGGGDPVKTGLVDSINRPSGNITGVTLYSNALEPKKLQLLRDLVPTATTIAVLVNPTSPQTQFVRTDVQVAAMSVGQKIQFLDASTEREIEEAFATISQTKIGALVVGSSPFFSTQREQIIALAARYAVPAIYDSRIQVVTGGLISYGSSYTETYQRAGVYAGRVLRGARTADLPILFPTKFELAINLKTAKALGLKVPLQLQQLADEVIE
jgi:putative tryptophan/tyrosine transport system substrate-binding protein